MVFWESFSINLNPNVKYNLNLYNSAEKKQLRSRKL